MLIPMVDDQDLTSRFLKTSIDHNLGVTVFQTADVSMANSTTAFQDSPNLAIPLLGVTQYVFDGIMLFTSPSTADIQLRLRVPLGSTAKVAWGGGSIATTEGTDIQFLTQAVTTSGALQSIQVSGWVSVAGSAEPLVMGFAQNTASASLTTLKLGSFLSAIKVS